MRRSGVEDEGPGIAPEDLPHVFERFYRAAEQSRRVKGSGLGLAIVKGFVTLSGGTVRVESSPAGTRFIITLPAAEARRRYAHERARMLVVDDEPQLRRALRRSLEGHGYNVREAEDGADGAAPGRGLQARTSCCST